MRKVSQQAVSRVCRVAAAAVFLSTGGASVPQPGEEISTGQPRLIARYSDDSRRHRPYAKDPSVVRFGRRYLMYYSIPPRETAGQSAAKFESGWAIGIAESADLANWRKVGEVLPVQAVERNGIAAPGAIVLGGKVHLFYQTYGNGPRDAINHAVSTDGVHFERDSGNPVFRPEGARWSAGRAIDAEPFVHGNRLLLYYATRDPSMKVQMVGVAAAPLGSAYGPRDWTNLSTAGPALAPELDWERQCIEAPSIVRRGRDLFMFYAGGYNNEPQQIGVATSREGLHWRRLSRSPLLADGPPGSWNDSESGHPGVFQDGKRTVLFFQGNPDRGHTWTIAAVAIGWNRQGPFVK